MMGAIPDTGSDAQPSPPPEPVDRPSTDRRHRGLRVLGAVATVAVIAGAVVVVQRLPGERSSATAPPGYVSFAASGIKLGAGQGESLSIGKPAPDFTLLALDGQLIRPADLRGKVVLINFWASWCAPCRKEMPLLVQAARRYRDRGFEVVAINIQEDRDRVSRFVGEFELDFPVLIDSAGDVTQQYRVQGLPTSYLIDREGVVRERKIGEYSRADLVATIERLLEQAGR